MHDTRKILIRTDDQFGSEILDPVAHRERKHARKRQQLQRGFFSVSSAPYKPIGALHLEDGELVLQGITDDLRPLVRVWNSKLFLQVYIQSLLTQ